MIIVVFNFVKQEHPVIKTACYHCLGQFCLDKKPDFQQRYSSEIFEVCGQGLSDKCPKVRAYSASCLNNLLLEGTWEMAKPFADLILEKLVIITSEDTIFVAKIAISALSSFTIVTNYNASKYFKRVFPTLISTFKQKHQRNIVLCCRLIECISIAAYYAEDSDFKEALPDIKYILKYFESIISSLEDQRVSYLLAAWNRLITRLRQSAEEFSEYLCSILVKVLGQCDEYKIHLTKKRSLLEADLYASPFDLDFFQVKTALRLLSSALSNMNLGLPKLEVTFDKLLQSCMVAASFIPEEEVATEATSCLEKLLKVVMKKDFNKVVTAQLSFVYFSRPVRV